MIKIATDISQSKQLAEYDVKSIEIETNDYSILITFDEIYSAETGYTTERAEWIKI